MAHLLGHREAMPTHNGRAAMNAVFSHLDLRREDEVFVTTTFDYPNVSSCVTCTIFNHCKPSRVLTDRTKLIFVIHEFGVPHPGTPDFKQEALRRGIPFVEDCAHTIDSVAKAGWHVGAYGDWVIVTFPKIFPVEFGGLLIGPKIPMLETNRQRTDADISARKAAAWWELWPQHAARRREVFIDLTARGLKPAFHLPERVTPWFFPLSVDDPGAVSQKVRERGIDCGHWHGTSLVVLPCHQFLADHHLDRIVQGVNSAVGNEATL